MFEAKGINPNAEKGEGSMHDATAAGRGYAVAGGVAEAVTNCIHEFYPDIDVKIEHAEGLAECKKVLMLAKAGKKNGCMIEGMCCPGGCIAGAGTILPIAKAKVEVEKMKKASSRQLPPKELSEIELD